jgi:hypothetical protein
MATTQSSIRVVKTFPYQAASAQEFSNRYFFDGSAPADDTAWHDLMDAVVAAEKAIYSSRVTIVACHGYNAGSEVAVANKTYTTAGTGTTFGTALCPGDCAAVLRMATTKRSTKNHTVYVFSYWHDVHQNGTTTPDAINNNQWTAMSTYGNAWLDGITVGARTYKRTTPDGHATTGRTVADYIGHRDFP